MNRFELERLTSYDENSLLDEIRRVAGLIQVPKISISDFDRYSKVHSTTLRHRFGGWREALVAAGVGDRFDDRSDEYSREEIIGHLQALAKQLGRSSVAKRELLSMAGISDRPIRRIFGSYRAALEAAGLTQTPGGARHSDEECFENLLNVWMALGRQPFTSDIKGPPSRIGLKAYQTRWGSWRKALAAFVDRANQESQRIELLPTVSKEQESPAASRKRTSRGIPWGMRYTVLKRDRFRCVLCGRSPATHSTLVLHIDHILAWANGGETVLENLRTLCEPCNLGKGSTREDI
jgi:hypothetical protein